MSKLQKISVNLTSVPGFLGRLSWELRVQKPLYCNIKNGHTETTRDSLLFRRIVTLHARLFKTLFSKSLMEIGSFCKYNDELCGVKAALGASAFSSLCLPDQGPRSNGERSDF